MPLFHKAPWPRPFPSQPPDPLPTPRRPLTPPPPPPPPPRIWRILSGRDTRPRETSAQEQSLFFNKLGVDIRLQIYREVLAPQDDELLHVATTNKRLCCFRCREQRENVRGWQHYCWGRMEIGDGTTRGREPHPRPHQETISGLLCACQRIYSEAIDILYKYNQIHVRQTRTIAEFPNVMVSYRLAMIRYLHLDTRLHYRWPLRGEGALNWPWDVLEYLEKACSVIRDQMPGLNTLHVSFGVARLTKLWLNEDTLFKILEHLATIKRISISQYLVRFHWRVRLDNALERLEIPAGELPFTIEILDIGDQPLTPW